MALTNRDQIAGIVGAAGAGKTTAMRAVASAYRAAGQQVIGLAPSTAAAGELRSAGADKTQSLAAFLEHGEPAGGGRLFILDEAGMVSARDMRQILDRLEKNDRLLLVGDPGQLAAVEQGSPFNRFFRHLCG